MQIAISLQEDEGLESSVSPIFGRCPFFMFVDVDNGHFEIRTNPAQSAAGGAGIQAAQMIAGNHVNAVISGKLGPKAYDVLASAGIAVYTFSGGSVEEALKAFRRGQLPAHEPAGSVGREPG
jgi:predicted Fe-Mo cluster-binding NifX family protein